jgi:hypothetical protein
MRTRRGKDEPDGEGSARKACNEEAASGAKRVKR